jgi:hypothetical protein
MGLGGGAIARRRFKVGGGTQHHFSIIGHGASVSRGSAEVLGQFQGTICFRHLLLRHSVDRAIIGFSQKSDRSGLYLEELENGRK